MTGRRREKTRTEPDICRVRDRDGDGDEERDILVFVCRIKIEHIPMTENKTRLVQDKFEISDHTITLIPNPCYKIVSPTVYDFSPGKHEYRLVTWSH